MQGRILRSIIFLAGVLPSQSILVKDHQQVQSGTRVETCSTLTNHQTYSSVEVAVGNPPQYFNLVADTGSNSCIVRDCACQQCPKEWGNCFTGLKKSSSFDLPLFKVMNASRSHAPKQGDMAPAAIVMTFGSGQIAAQIASDEVRIGEVRTYMKKGLLLMVDHALNLEGPFEGILGLGRPEVKENLTKNDYPQREMMVPGFFDSAHVQRFSMCFNREADGVLGINTPQHLNRLSSVGKLHWGLDFQGVSVGNKQMKVGFCDPSTKRPGMETACGIIPDSGTTLIAGAEAHIEALFESVCQSWERCTTMHRELLKELKKKEAQGIVLSGGGYNYSNTLGLIYKEPGFLPALVSRLLEEGPPKPLHPGVVKVKKSTEETAGADPMVPGSANQSFELPQALTLQLLLEHCASWIKDVDLNKEMPKLIFHVAGANGNKQELVISPRNYVLAKAMDIEVPSVSNVFGIPLTTKKIQNQKVCMMAFSPTDYTTELNGDVWIMGTPLFYEYSAHYDRGDGMEKEVTMGFTHRSQEECGKCQGHKIVREPHSLIWSDTTRTDANSSSIEGTGMDALKSLDKQPVTRSPASRESI